MKIRIFNDEAQYYITNKYTEMNKSCSESELLIGQYNENDLKSGKNYKKLHVQNYSSLLLTLL